LIIVQPQPPSPELLAQNTVLFAKVVNDLQLAVIHPPGNRDQNEPKWVQDSAHLVCSLSPVPVIP
jgi:hypothetical protein